jgi:hypothetical protein
MSPTLTSIGLWRWQVCAVTRCILQPASANVSDGAVCAVRKDVAS